MRPSHCTYSDLSFPVCNTGLVKISGDDGCRLLDPRQGFHLSFLLSISSCWRDRLGICCPDQDTGTQRGGETLQVTQQAGVSGFSLGHVSGLGPCGCCHRPPWPACFLPRRPLYPRPPSGTLPQPEACPPPSSCLQGRTDTNSLPRGLSETATKCSP